MAILMASGSDVLQEGQGHRQFRSRKGHDWAATNYLLAKHRRPGPVRDLRQATRIASLGLSSWYSPQ